uniref:Fibronectin type-III domain-containing protein n=1 Tax=Macrostomum lignano TaxID=282301 RepID=A0A1I8FCF5_9PLAT
GHLLAYATFNTRRHAENLSRRRSIRAALPRLSRSRISAASLQQAGITEEALRQGSHAWRQKPPSIELKSALIPLVPAAAADAACEAFYPCPEISSSTTCPTQAVRRGLLIEYSTAKPKISLQDFRPNREYHVKALLSWTSLRGKFTPAEKLSAPCAGRAPRARGGSASGYLGAGLRRACALPRLILKALEIIQPLLTWQQPAAPPQPDPPKLGAAGASPLLTVAWQSRPAAALSEDEFVLQMNDEDTGHGFMTGVQRAGAQPPGVVASAQEHRAINDDGASKWSAEAAYATPCRTSPGGPTTGRPCADSRGRTRSDWAWEAPSRRWRNAAAGL